VQSGRVALAASALALGLFAAGCSANPSSRASQAPTASEPSLSTATTACTLQRTTHYIERMAEPGLLPAATEVWNANLANCTSTLQNFPQEVGIGQGECTQIALASENPDYNVLARPASPLRDVITQAGPGC
jgi:hypothetical protein